MLTRLTEVAQRTGHTALFGKFITHQGACNYFGPRGGGSRFAVAQVHWRHFASTGGRALELKAPPTITKVKTPRRRKQVSSVDKMASSNMRQTTLSFFQPKKVKAGTDEKKVDVGGSASAASASSVAPAAEVEVELDDDEATTTIKKSVSKKSKSKVISDSESDVEVEEVERKKVKREEKEVKMDVEESTPQLKSQPTVQPKIESSQGSSVVSHEIDLESDEALEIIENSEIDDPEWKWEPRGPVPYASLCALFAKVEATTKRLEILAYVTTFLKKVIVLSPQNFTECVYLCINRIAPEYEGKELGIGESILIKAIANTTGRPPKSIKDDLHKLGDLGQVAQRSKGRQMSLGKPKPLTVSAVFKTLTEIANVSGNNSQNLKVGKINKLLAACNGVEPKYLIRSLEGKLRIGLAEQSILHAIGQATAMTTGPIEERTKNRKRSTEKKDEIIHKAVEDVKRVFSELPNYDIVLKNILMYGVGHILEHCKLQPGIPLKPMLAHPTKSISEVLDRFDGVDFTCEYKYDGERAQVHLIPTEEEEELQVKIYSRNLESLTEKYPDVRDIVKEIIGKVNAEPGRTEKTKSFVIDCEVVAWDREKNCILPFQVLSTRKRKDVDSKDVSVQVCLFAFDILYLNGEALTKSPFRTRKSKLYSAFEPIQGKFNFAQHKECSEIDEIQMFLDASIEGNCEGLMVKTLDGDEATYEPSRRSRNWLKVKKDYLAGVGDTFDLVVVGAYLGKGKRTGWYGGYLLACFNPDTEEYETICKIGTGFSEENLELFHRELKDGALDVAPSYYSFAEGSVKPDVWFEPKMVWEVKAADLSISPVYKAAIGVVNQTKGISLRFPRFIRVRDDKKAEQATSSEQVADFYRSQKQNTNSLQDAFDDDY